MKRISCVLLVAATACATSTQTGTLVGGTGGAAAGAGIGALAGGKKGAIIGALAGGVAGGVSGALIGRYMDNQKEALDRDLKSGYVEKRGNKLVVRFASGILFDTDDAQLKPAAQQELAEFARVLNKYEDTDLTILGFTDSSGSREHNKKLSAARAESVVTYLTQAGVARRRLVSQGFGEDRAAASNDTAEGRAKNRRVEIHIEADEDLRQADAAKAKQM